MESAETHLATFTRDEVALTITLATIITYKAMHHVPRLDHPVHSNAHFHLWTVEIEVEGEADAHELQAWQHKTAPHFGDHGPLSTEQVAKWWYHKFVDYCESTRCGLSLKSIYVKREDGVSARLTIR